MIDSRSQSTLFNRLRALRNAPSVRFVCTAPLVLRAYRADPCRARYDSSCHFPSFSILSYYCHQNEKSCGMSVWVGTNVTIVFHLLSLLLGLTPLLSLPFPSLSLQHETRNSIALASTSTHTSTCVFTCNEPQTHARTLTQLPALPLDSHQDQAVQHRAMSA
jgi:hypothetical protein